MLELVAFEVKLRCLCLGTVAVSDRVIWWVVRAVLFVTLDGLKLCRLRRNSLPLLSALWERRVLCLCSTTGDADVGLLGWGAILTLATGFSIGLNLLPLLL